MDGERSRRGEAGSKGKGELWVEGGGGEGGEGGERVDLWTMMLGRALGGAGAQKSCPSTGKLLFFFLTHLAGEQRDHPPPSQPASDEQKTPRTKGKQLKLADLRSLGSPQRKLLARCRGWLTNAEN